MYNRLVINRVRNKWAQYYIVSWEPERHYHYSRMFHWEPEGRYHHWLCTAIAPFWFSTEHRWIAITPFWLSTDDMYFYACILYRLFWIIKQPFSTVEIMGEQCLFCGTRLGGGGALISSSQYMSDFPVLRYEQLLISDSFVINITLGNIPPPPCFIFLILCLS